MAPVKRCYFLSVKHLASSTRFTSNKVISVYDEIEHMNICTKKLKGEVQNEKLF